MMDIDTIIKEVKEKAEFIGYYVDFDQENEDLVFKLITPEYLKKKNNRDALKIAEEMQGWDSEEDKQKTAKTIAEWRRHHETKGRKGIHVLIYRLFCALNRIKNNRQINSDLPTALHSYTALMKIMESLTKKTATAKNTGKPQTEKWREAVEFYNTLPKDKNGKIIQTVAKYDKAYKRGKDIKKCGALLQVKEKYGIKSRETMFKYLEMYEDQKKANIF